MLFFDIIKHEASGGIAALAAVGVRYAGRWSAAASACNSACICSSGENEIILHSRIEEHPRRRYHVNRRRHMVRAVDPSPSRRGRRVLPRLRCLRPEQAKCAARNEVALQAESVVDGGVHAEKSLGRSGRLEALHLSLSSSDRLMRILGQVVLAQTLLMTGRKTQVLPRGAIGPQLVGHPHAGSKALLPE